MRRKILRTLVFLAAIAWITTIWLPTAFAAPQDEYTYTLSSGQATVTGYTGAGGAISIPSTLGGCTVTAIAPCAFSGNTTIHSVVFPAGIIHIGASSFEGCSSLSALYFQGNTPTLGTNALLFCADELKVYYPAGKDGWADPWNNFAAQAYDPFATYTVTYDGNGATAGSAPTDTATYLTGESVAVSGAGSLTKGSDQFTGWNAKPDGTGTIYTVGNMFAITKDLTLYARWSRDLTRGTPTTCTVDGISWSYTPLGQEYCEVNGCSPVPANLSIPSVLQGRKVIGVGIDAFDSAEGVQNVTLPSTVEYIARMAFRNCPDLMSVTLPDSVTEIGAYAFYLCENLVSVKFPSGITNLGDGAFQCCSRLTSAVFTGNAPMMGELTFDRCARGFQIYRADTASGWTNPYNALSVQTYHPSDTYTITYDVNGGVGTVPSAVTNRRMGDVFVAAGQGGMRNGYYSFAGWNTRPDGTGTAYEVGGRIAVTGNVTLYALWYMNYREANFQTKVDIGGATWWYTPIGEFFCTVYNREGASGFVTIPDFIDGRMVIGVGQNAFGYNEDITGVSIPANVTTITKFAFQYCPHLSTVVFRGDAPAEVGYQVMKYCADNLTVHYPVGASGWPDTWNGFAAQSYDASDFYTVTYDGNGAHTGSAPTDTASYQAFTAASVMGNVGNLAKQNYSFGGWNTQPDGNGIDYQAGDPLVITKNIRLYAQWYLGNCSIGYDRQDGSAVGRWPVNYGTSLPAPASPTRTGYTFGGWYPTAACNTIAISFPYTVTGNATLYAKWTLNRYTVTFDSRGGSAIAAVTVNHGDSITTPVNPSRTGYIFGGWYPSADCNTTAAPFPYTVTGNVTLYAKWTQNPAAPPAPATYTVRFDSRGGSSIAAVTANHGDRITAPANPGRTGYTFTGWYKDAACTAPWNFALNTVTGNMTLYAGWAAQTQSNLLRDIALSSGALSRAFGPKTTSYTLNLSENTGSVTITPVRAFDGATMTIDGKKVNAKTVSLANGRSATVMIKVTWNKKTTTYKLTINRPKSTNNLLSSLSASTGVWSGTFDPKVTNYTLKLPENVAKVTIYSARQSSLATVTPARRTYTLKNGQTVKVTVKVKSQSGATRTYTITITRARY